MINNLFDIKTDTRPVKSSDNCINKITYNYKIYKYALMLRLNSIKRFMFKFMILINYLTKLKTHVLVVISKH